VKTPLLFGTCLIALACLRPTSLTAAADRDPRIEALLSQVSADRLAATVKSLAAFGTRHLYSDTESPARGIGAAREWIRQQFIAASPRLQVAFDTYQVAAQGGRLPRDVEIRNVVAVLPGHSARRIYVTGHYDSVARRTDGTAGAEGFDWTRADNDAPGANDDGSGTALVLELARVIGASAIDFDATMVFVAFAGEEEGLVGSTLHAQRAASEHWPIDAVLNNDIVGGSHGGDGVIDTAHVRVFSEGPEDSGSRALARYVQRMAARYVPEHDVVLAARADRFGRGGDHTPFNQEGFAAVRVTEARENYARQHSVLDTPDGVDAQYLQRNAQVNLAALASLALAPAAPSAGDSSGRPRIARGESGYDAHLSWTPSAGAAAYRIFWRRAWAVDWEHELTLGDVSQATVHGVSIDDVVFGVAAVDLSAHESLITAYVVQERPRLTVRQKP
jgi:peptidase M28-like protein